MKDFVFVANINGDILFMNNEGNNLLNFGINNTKSFINLFELFSEQSNAEIKEKIAQASLDKIQKLEPILVEMHINSICISKKIIISLFYDNQNELALITGHIECLYEATDSFEISKQLYLGFIDNLPLGVYRTGINGEIHFVNKGFIKILGFESAEEMYQVDIRTLYVDSNIRENQIKKWEDDEMHSFEIQMHTKDDQTIWVKDSGRAIKNELGSIIFLDGILEDITKQKDNELKLIESENLLKELNASKDKFFSIISHDLRAPFNQLIGATELLLTKLEEYDKVMIRKFLTLLNNEAVSSYRLLENLLQWSKSQRGLIKFDPKPVNFPQLIDDLLLIYAPMADNKKIDLEIVVPRDLYVYGDKEMLSTIMRNLLSNAIKFTDEGGLIAISVEEKIDESDMMSEFVLVSVIDNGVGIPEDTISQLFTLSGSGSVKGTYNESGTGLGLVLCKDFVEKHNGKIWVESTYGSGSAFYFTIK